MSDILFSLRSTTSDVASTRAVSNANAQSSASDDSAAAAFAALLSMALAPMATEPAAEPPSATSGATSDEPSAADAGSAPPSVAQTPTPVTSSLGAPIDTHARDSTTAHAAFRAHENQSSTPAEPVTMGAAASASPAAPALFTPSSMTMLGVALRQAIESAAETRSSQATSAAQSGVTTASVAQLPPSPPSSPTPNDASQGDLQAGFQAGVPAATASVDRLIARVRDELGRALTTGDASSVQSLLDARQQIAQSPALLEGLLHIAREHGLDTLGTQPAASSALRAMMMSPASGTSAASATATTPAAVDATTSATLVAAQLLASARTSLSESSSSSVATMGTPAAAFGAAAPITQSAHAHRHAHGSHKHTIDDALDEIEQAFADADASTDPGAIATSPLAPIFTSSATSSMAMANSLASAAAAANRVLATASTSRAPTTSPSVTSAPAAEPSITSAAATSPSATTARAAERSMTSPPAAAGGRAAPVPDSNLATIDSDLSGLAPAFRVKLDRVMSRMRADGHDVQVVETYRDQQRQDRLFAQGRTAPGPVVTWTRSSNHTDGRAADVVLDGTNDSPSAYAQLAQIAQEEGLRTLGPRDPGHIELPRAQSAAPQAASGATGTPVTSAQPALASIATPRPMAVAAPAAPAQVAPVAQVARVATVAQVAFPGVTSAAGAPVAGAPGTALTKGVLRTAPGSVQSDRAAQRNGAAVIDPATRRAADSQRDTERDRSRDAGKRVASAPTRASADADAPQPAHVTTSAPVARAQTDAIDAQAPIARPDTASAVAQALDLRDDARPLSLSHVVLRVDNADGGQDRIRVDLRDNIVGATIDVHDGSSADQLASKIGELQRSLEQHGLEADALHVRSIASAGAPVTSDLSHSTAAAALQVLRDVDVAQRTASAHGGAFTPGRERGQDQSSGSDGSQRGSHTSDDARQRARREQKGDDTR